MRYKSASAAVTLTRALIGLNCRFDLVESDACAKPTRGTTASIVSGYIRLSGTDLKLDEQINHEGFLGLTGSHAADKLVQTFAGGMVGQRRRFPST